MNLSFLKKLPTERPLLTIILAVLALRLPSAFQSVIDWDESIYILVSRELLNGFLPYTAVFDHKPIGLYYIFATFLGVFGDDAFSVRILGMGAVIGSCVLLRQILIDFGGVRSSTALTLALAYAVATGGLGGAATNTEILANFLTLSWIFAVLVGVRTNNIWPFLWAGVAMGLSFQINYLAGLTILGFAAGYLLLRLSHEPKYQDALQAFVVDGLVIFCGFAAASAVLIVPLYFSGVIEQYFELQSAYLFNYRPEVSTAESLERFFETAQAFLPLVAIVWFGWVLGARRDRIVQGCDTLSFTSLARFLLPILIAAFVALSTSFRFYQHYFLLLLPPLFLLCGLVLARFPPQTLFVRFGVVLLVVASFNLGIRGFIEAGRGGAVAAQMLFAPETKADPSRALAQKIKPLLKEGDTIYVACNQTILYQLVGVSPPTQFAHYPHSLAESYAKAFGVTVDDRIDEILAMRPRVIVLGHFDRCRSVSESVWSLLEEKIQFSGYEFYQDYRGGRLFVRPSAPPVRLSRTGP